MERESTSTNEDTTRNIGNMNTIIQNSLFAAWLAGEVNKVLHESPNNTGWFEIDKRNFPRKAFLWVDDEDRRSTWHLPYRQGTGNIDKKSGYYESAGAVNLNVLRAVAQVLESHARDDKLNIPAKIRSKINNVLEVNKIGRFSTGEGSMEIHEASISSQFAGAKLDKDNCIVENVAVLSPTSRNKFPQHKSAKGRFYTEKARLSVATLVEGVKAYCDHATDAEMKQRGGVRSVRDLLGHYKGGRLDEKGIVRANLHYMPNHAEWFEPLVERMSDKIGNSIHAFGEVTYDQKSLMENVVDVGVLSSIDLVTETGSTKNLFESKPEENELEIKDLSLKDLTESRPDLISEITKQVTASLQGDSKATALEAQVKALTESNTALKGKVDESELKEQLAEKKTEIDKALKESKLKEAHVSKTFREQLDNAEDTASVKQLIEDREKLVSEGKGVTGMGRSTEKLEESEVNGEFDNLTGIIRE